MITVVVMSVLDSHTLRAIVDCTLNLCRRAYKMLLGLVQFSLNIVNVVVQSIDEKSFNLSLNSGQEPHHLYAFAPLT